jgi:hypothetical protein
MFSKFFALVPENIFGNEILISDCPYANIAPLCPTLAPASLTLCMEVILKVFAIVQHMNQNYAG